MKVKKFVIFNLFSGTPLEKKVFIFQKLFIITELCEAGELAKWLKKNGPMKEDKSKIIMRKIVDAISYLHKNGRQLFLKKSVKAFFL